MTDEYEKKTISLYCKDELPTWSEIYEEFWTKKLFTYDPGNLEHQEEDPYWKRPRRKLMLAWGCNQLNKIIFEDGLNIIPFINENFEGFSCEKVQFILAEDPYVSLPTIQDSVLCDIGPPKIYTCKLPSTDEHSIFMTKYPRIDIDTITKPVELVVILESSDECTMETDEDELLKIIEFVLGHVIAYFENGVGWKDNNGNVIPSDPVTRACEGVGYDPAL